MVSFRLHPPADVFASLDSDWLVRPASLARQAANHAMPLAVLEDVSRMLCLMEAHANVSPSTTLIRLQLYANNAQLLTAQLALPMAPARLALLLRSLSSPNVSVQTVTTQSQIPSQYSVLPAVPTVNSVLVLSAVDVCPVSSKRVLFV